MKNKLTLILCLISVCAYSQIDTATNRRTTVIGQLPKIITDAHLRAASSLSIPYVASTTPSMNGAINRAGYGLQLLSNLRLAVGIGASSFSQFMGVTELTAALALKANLASPTFTGAPLSTTATAGTSTTQIATTAFVTTADNLKANLASPALTGTPTSTTAAVETNTTQIATTAFVQQEILADRIVNTTTTALTTSDLNTAYPNVKIGFRVICHLITGAPAIYTKATEDGSSDVWLTTSATVTP